MRTMRQSKTPTLMGLLLVAAGSDAFLVSHNFGSYQCRSPSCNCVITRPDGNVYSSNPNHFTLHMAQSPKQKKLSVSSKMQDKKSGKVDESKSKSLKQSRKSSTASSKTILPKNSNVPWKVMSKDDVDRNAQSERQRRMDVEQGKISSSDGVQEAKQQKLADISSSQILLSAIDKNLVSWKRFHPDTALGGVSLVGSFLGTKLPPSLGVPEVAFLGRSNVGKSSLLNKLCTSTSVSQVGSSYPSSADNVQLARVGKTPGATASVNLYALLAKDKRAGGSGNSQKPLLGFVDLPGFGFAKLSKDLKQSVEVAAERYLNKRSKKELALCILLVDIRRVPSEEDRAVLAALYDLGAPLLVVATKIDKLTSNELSASLEVVRSGLGLPEGQPFHVSSSTGTGIRELWSIILDACEDRVNEIRGSLENGGRVSIGDAEEDIGDTVPLDEEGNFVDENDEMEGYEWIQKYGSSFDEKKTKTQSVRDEGRTSFRLKDWKQRAKDMVSRGEI